MCEAVHEEFKLTKTSMVSSLYSHSYQVIDRLCVACFYYVCVLWLHKNLLYIKLNYQELLLCVRREKNRA
jgi:hypothetical protein